MLRLLSPRLSINLPGFSCAFPRLWLGNGVEKVGQPGSEEAGGVEGLASGPGGGGSVLPVGQVVLLLRAKEGDEREAEEVIGFLYPI